MKNNISNKEDVYALSEEMSNLDFNSRCHYELMYQILNSKSNFYQPLHNISNLFTIISRVLIKNPENKLFTNSLINSRKCYNDPNLIYSTITSLKIHNASSFLIILVQFSDHIVPVIVRKFFHSYYTLTVITKTRKTFLYNAINEYNINDSNIVTSISNIIGISESQGFQSIYGILEEQSFENYSINIDENASNNNFFLKELETAIKYAYSTRTYNANDIISIKSTNNLCFKLSWGISSESFYKEISEEIKESYPMISNLIDFQYSRYLLNKNISRRNSINEMLKNFKVLNYNTFIKNRDIFKKYSQDMNDNLKDEVLTKTLSILTSVDRCAYFHANIDNFDELRNSLCIISSKFVFLSKQFSYEFHLCYLILAIWEISNFNFNKAIKYLDNAKNLYSLNPIVSFLTGICFIEKEHLLLNSSMTEPSTNIKNAIKHFDLCIQINPLQSEAYVLRGFCKSLFENTIESEKDFLEAAKVGLWNKKTLNKYSIADSVQISQNKIVGDFLAQINASRVLKSSSLKDRKYDLAKIFLSGYFKPNIQLQKEKIEKLFKIKRFHVDPNSTSVTKRRISFK